MRKLLLLAVITFVATAAFGVCDNTSTAIGGNWTQVGCNWNSSGGTPATTVNVSYTFTAHHVGVVFVNQPSNSGQTLTVTSSLNTWTCRPTSNFAAAGLNLAICYVLDSTAGADTLSCTSNVSNTFLGCVVGEFSNSGGVSPGFDTSGYTQSATGSTNFTMSQSLTLAQTNELVIAGATVSNGPYTNVGGWLSLNISAAGVTTSAPAAAANFSASSGSFNAQIIDQANSDSYIMSGIAFLPPSGFVGTVLGGKIAMGGKATLGH